MTRKRKGKTASEFMAELEQDPVFLAQRRQRDEAFQRKAEEYAGAEAPIVEELRDAGAAVSSVWELVNSREPYPALVPILIDHLDRSYPERVREGIARALAVPESRSAWDTLVSSFLAEKDTSSTGVKWAIALAVSAAADVAKVDELIKFACDRRHGENRVPFVYALGRIGGPIAKAALAELSNDPELAEDVRIAQSKRR